MTELKTENELEQRRSIPNVFFLLVHDDTNESNKYKVGYVYTSCSQLSPHTLISRYFFPGNSARNCRGESIPSVVLYHIQVFISKGIYYIFTQSSMNSVNHPIFISFQDINLGSGLNLFVFKEGLHFKFESKTFTGALTKIAWTQWIHQFYRYRKRFKWKQIGDLGGSREIPAIYVHFWLQYSRVGRNRFFNLFC